METRHVLKAVDTERRLFGGWAYQWRDADGEIVVDHSGDFIDIPEAEEALVDAFTDYVLKDRTGDDQHEVFGASTLVGNLAFTEDVMEALGWADLVKERGIFTVYRADDTPQGEQLWDRIKSGEAQMLSIVGARRDDA